MELERRDDDRWHLVMANCGSGGATHETIKIEPDDGFTRKGDKLHLRIPSSEDLTWCEACQATIADRYAQASDAIDHWKVATTYRKIEWSDYDGAIDGCGWCQNDVETLVHDQHMSTIVCEVCAALYNSSATDPGDAIMITDYVHLADEVEPIVVVDNGSGQQSAARIDRRPYISLKPKRKYVTVTVTLTYVGYQFTEAAITHLREIFETYEGRAFQQSDNKGGVEFEVNRHQSRRESRPRQEIVINGLFEADAREFIDEILPLVRTTTTNWTYDPSDVSAQVTRRAIRKRGQDRHQSHARVHQRSPSRATSSLDTFPSPTNPSQTLRSGHTSPTKRIVTVRPSWTPGGFASIMLMISREMQMATMSSPAWDSTFGSRAERSSITSVFVRARSIHANTSPVHYSCSLMSQLVTCDRFRRMTSWSVTRRDRGIAGESSHASR